MSDKLTLQEIANITNQLEESLIENDGQITPEIAQMLEVKETKLPEKIDRIGGLMDRMSYLADYYKSKADTFNKMAKSALKINEFLKLNLSNAMKSLDTQELTGRDTKFKLQKSPIKLLIVDEELIENKYKIQTVITEIDKVKLKEDLMKGEYVHGAMLVQDNHIRQYVNTPGSKKIDKQND